MGMSPIAEDIRARLARYIPPKSAICVAFSGGIDSVVLLELLAEHGVEAGYAISALHIHHGISPNADEWVRFCERFCANQGVPLTVEYVQVDTSSPLGLEAAARVARYAAFAARPEPYLAVAHHLDDQAETVLLQLLRGTGLKGISAMPEIRELRGTGVQIFRPLLGHSRADLRTYAQEQGLRWIEDESNASTLQDRNLLRHDVGPIFDARYKGWREALARFARHAGAANLLLDDLASIDGAPAQPGQPLPLDPTLSEERRANVLRAFLARNAVAMPSEARLDEMVRQLYEAREDARIRIDHAGISIVRHRGAALIDRHLRPPEKEVESWRVEWLGDAEIPLGADRGTIRFEAVTGEGIGLEALAEGGAWFFAPRSGGETIRLEADRPTRTLKNLLQEREIPVWQRDLPLLFHGDRLVWVPGIGIAADYLCQAGQPGLRPSWAVAGRTPLC